MGTFCERRQQYLVGDNIDTSQQSFGVLLNFFSDAVADQFRTGIAHLAHAEIQVIVNLLLGQRLQFEMVGNTLAQLANGFYGKILVQLRLTKKDDLQ